MLALRIMPMGDSLTEGYFLPEFGGYRIYLDEKLRNFRLYFDFVGSGSSGPGHLLDKNHEGHQGENISYFTGNLATWYGNTPWDVVLVHVGTAHIINNGAGSSSGTQALLESLINGIYAQNSASIVVLAKIPPLTAAYSGLNADVVTYNSQVLTVAAAQVALGRNVVVANMYDAGVTTSDGAHPTDAGYRAMSSVWLPAIVYDALGYPEETTVATTTMAEIFDQWVSDIKAISPANLADKKFDRSPTSKPLVDWALLMARDPKALRKFDVKRTGSVTPATATHGATQRDVIETATITVAYPVYQAMYRKTATPDDLLDMDEVVRRDARDIYDVIRSPSNYVSGHHESAVEIMPPDTSRPEVYFQEFVVVVRYTEAMTL